eukprot:scaffold66_cov115-Cylindrotheca_fusiformis.AAC.13
MGMEDSWYCLATSCDLQFCQTLAKRGLDGIGHITKPQLAVDFSFAMPFGCLVPPKTIRVTHENVTHWDTYALVGPASKRKNEI